MTKTVWFTNPGEIDIRAVTMLGVNVKESDNSIGFFGTGLKYAIAVLLRERQAIEIASGTTRYCFRKQLEVIRGKEFYSISYQQSNWHGNAIGSWTPLGWTTELGKNWTLENAYRELWSNSKDEKGQVVEAEPPAGAGRTVIAVTGDEFAHVHRTREAFLLGEHRRPLAANADLELYTGSSQVVFYHGIAALKLSKPSRYTYNIIGQAKLTEDRTFDGGDYPLSCALREYVAREAEVDIARDIITVGEDYWEGTLHFGWSVESKENFQQAAKLAISQSPLKVNATAVALYKRSAPKEETKLEWVSSKLTREEEAALEGAQELVQDWGFDTSKFETIVVKDTGSGTLGRADDGRIILAREVLLQRDLLLRALVEEFIHLEFDVRDESCEMQNVLFGQIVRLGFALRDSEPAPAAAPPPPSPSTPDEEMPF